jgi:hypothetical protein
MQSNGPLPTSGVCVTKCDILIRPLPSDAIIPFKSSGLPSMTTPRAIWTVDDETVLIDYLDEHQAEAGDGLSFKMPTWNWAAVKVAESTMKGGLKDGTGCKNKWACICCSILVVLKPF